MKRRKFNGFDKNGYIPPGMYNMNFKEFEGIFCNNSSKRKEITEEYKKHLSEIKNTGYFLDYWIGGSFVTTKENPSDIDTLTEFDGFEAEKNNEQAKIDDLIFNSKSKTKGLCRYTDIPLMIN